MSHPARFDLSVILPFADDEETLGTTVRRVATFVREHGLAFELIAVDEDSGDNSHAVLAMLRPEVPELRVTHAPTRGRGVEAGVARAQGRMIAVIACGLPATQLPSLIRSVESIGAGTADLEFMVGEYIVAHRVRSLDAFHGVRIAGEATQRRLAKRLVTRGFRVVIDGAPLSAPAARTTKVRWLDAFAPRRAS